MTIIISRATGPATATPAAATKRGRSRRPAYACELRAAWLACWLAAGTKGCTFPKYPLLSVRPRPRRRRPAAGAAAPRARMQSYVTIVVRAPRRAARPLCARATTPGAIVSSPSTPPPAFLFSTFLPLLFFVARAHECRCPSATRRLAAACTLSIQSNPIQSDLIRSDPIQPPDRLNFRASTFIHRSRRRPSDSGRATTWTRPGATVAR
mmetsp:Transcript_3537/g.10896  ORF Transcript_3537/g.10896 Transcript_3537/m.10896 type:complete len:209 (-) Transcript_3537:771-1397(-)